MLGLEFLVKGVVRWFVVRRMIVDIDFKGNLGQVCYEEKKDYFLFLSGGGMSLMFFVCGIFSLKSCVIFINIDKGNF